LAAAYCYVAYYALYHAIHVVAKYRKEALTV